MKRSQLDVQVLVLVTLALVAFGLVMVYSATSASAAISNGDPNSFLKRQGIYAAIGLVLLFVFSRINFRTLRKLAPMLVLGSLVLCVAVLILGTAVNGARRWISFGPVVFQPSELAKLALAVWAAWFLTRRGAPRSLRELARPMGLLIGIFCVLLLAEPDLGTAIALVLMIGGMLAVAGTPGRTLLAGGTIVTVLGVAAAWFEPYRRARIFSFLNPWGDSQGAGYQTVQAIIGLGSGGFFGTGLGHSVQKLSYLPEAHTDMIFAVIGEELGFVGSMGLIAAYAAFAYAGLRIALRCTDPFGKTLAAGIVTLVCAQAAVNLAAVLGLAPLTGIPLPFVSYGGSNLVVALAAVGILLNIGRDREAERAARVSDRSRGDGGARDARAGDRRRIAEAGRERELRRVARSG
ncbi:MAG: putative lipid II flippase FtsW [Actinobacteria bacterium]|nr:putative lipid II flippase FtsW [Actinomycetota bacterium]